MSNNLILDGNKLNTDLTNLANEIRIKSGNTNKMTFPNGFISEINNLNVDIFTPPTDNPNQDRPYSDKLVATFSNTNDVNDFCNIYNHKSNYASKELSLSPGNRIVINDGVYNQTWMIGGFDCEYKQKAADETIYDNGYGIVLIPVGELCKHEWNANNRANTGYNGSDIHKFLDSTVSPNLKKILGNNIVERNVLLSNSIINTVHHANSYVWTKAYATLMSIGQMNGAFAKNNNKFDDGEANYQLPVFKYTPFNNGLNFWSRGICTEYDAWYSSNGGYEYFINFRRTTIGVRPLIYIR